MMAGNPARPLQVENISGLGFDGMSSWCSALVANDISILIGRRTDESEVLVIGGPAWRCLLRISERMRIVVFNAKDGD